MSALRKTHLFSFHKANGRLTEFAGFSMPVWYKGITVEHMAVRECVGIFDVSHMGRCLVNGPQAESFLNYVTTNDVSSLNPLSAQYTTFCNHNGGIKDDLVISKLEENSYLVVYNASNREKDYRWLKDNSEKFDVKVEESSDSIAMFAVQGPKAELVLQRISTQDLSSVKRFKCVWTEIEGCKTFVSRTGYTGEDGFELFVWNTSLQDPRKAFKVWNSILSAGASEGIEPCGLGARDTLRLEAGMCLYGNDLTEETTPLEAGLSFVVKFHKGDFIGREALLKQKEEGIKRKRVGIRLLERGIPRPGQEVIVDGEVVGLVTSGTLSPLLKVGIAMAYLPVDLSKEGTAVKVKIRRRLVDGTVVKLPFYRRLSENTVYLMGRKVSCPVGDWETLRSYLEATNA
ncbi:glycine cleavage system aminomethyltransferase GcvT [Candidatus Bathyarchaeota archaeon]|nr:glycine cleavage system aminomethyltransferase GcvT [Candidatus Bathyarchaeota archaeon]